MTQPNYLKCTRSHFKKDNQLKFVCLNQSCRQSNLCCEQCINDYHEGHSKKQLKTLLTIANYLKAKGPTNSKNSPTNPNRNNLLNIVQQTHSKTINSFKTLSKNIITTLEYIEANLEQYFKELNDTINKPHGQQDPVKLLQTTLTEINTGKDYDHVVKNIKKLLLLLNKVGKDGHLQPIENHQEVLQKIVSQSNKEIADLINIKLTDMHKILTQSQTFIINSTANAQDLWQNPLFNFSASLCHQQIKVQDSTKVVSKVDDVYQMALMEPQINMNSQNQVFRFKISKLTSNWISVGVGFKKIIEEKQFTFDPYNINHGAFMISANGGAWAHQTPEMNNKVRSFKFEEGDIITCIVDPEIKKIYFVKESDVSEMKVGPKETFELSFADFEQQPLHPCVAIHYLDNSVEYIPATNSSQIPKYDYLFSSSLKHAQINVTNNKSVQIQDNGCAESGYRACLFNKPVNGNWNKHFSFRIATCDEDWLGVGICQKSIVEKNSYGFDYENQAHGFYMISCNGGVWSSTDSTLNNKLACWKFKAGDVIDCEVETSDGPQFSNKKIIFKKGNHQYVLPFQCPPQQKIYPCVMLHYVGDQVTVLPLF